MKTEKQRAQIFLVLVPHRDARLVLRNYSDALFRAGVTGAYHFPWAAPLAALSRPLDTEELKCCARALREAAGGRKICAGEASLTTFPAESDTLLFGPRLDITIPLNALGGGASKVSGVFSQPVLGSCLLSADEVQTQSLPPPKLSFRAAAVANMFWRPLQAGGIVIGYKWKIGKLCWLPAVGKN